MDFAVQTDSRRMGFDRVPRRMKLAMTELWEATQYAEQTSGDYWEFAVNIGRLTDCCRLNCNDLRWLVGLGLVEHRREPLADNFDRSLSREFQRSTIATFTDQSCFILTDSGVLFAQQSCGAAAPRGAIENLGSMRSGSDIPLTEFAFTVFDRRGGDGPMQPPHWDAQRRVLSLAGAVIKRFKWAAENQEVILSAFEEERWPARIDDPLTPQHDQDPKRRLSDTIKSLNRSQHHPLVHFRGDGSGEGVVWEYSVS